MNKFIVLAQAKRQPAGISHCAWAYASLLESTTPYWCWLRWSCLSLRAMQNVWQAALWLALTASMQPLPTPHDVSLTPQTFHRPPALCHCDSHPFNSSLTPHVVSLIPHVASLTPHIESLTHIMSLTSRSVCRRDHHLLRKLMEPRMPHSDRGRPMTWGSWHIAQKPRHEALCSNVNAY